jgi:hypothetical protein
METTHGSPVLQSRRKTIGILKRSPHRFHRGDSLGAGRALAIAASLAALLGSISAGAEDPAPGPSVGLDQLLRLPPPRREAMVESPDRPGGANESEWRTRFADARQVIAQAEEALDDAKTKLAKVSTSSGQWQMAAPGLGGKTNSNPQNSPVSFELHQEIRHQREEIERGEYKLQELKVEASLAGVPEPWTRLPDAKGADPTTSSAQP